MFLARLANAMIDDTISLVEFLPLVREGRHADDSWTRDYAATAFLHKCSIASPSDWEQVKEELRNEAPGNEYLLKIGTLGHLAMDFSNPNREYERAEITQGLLRTDPGDPCLGNPYAYGLDDEWYQKIKPEWLEKLNEHPDEVRVLSNAAQFFFRRDKEIAEDMYLKCAALEPDNDFWQERVCKLREFHAPSVD